MTAIRVDISTWLTLSLLLCHALADWTVTSYYVVEQSTSSIGSYAYTRSVTKIVKSDATPTVTAALSVATTTVSYKDLEVVQIYLPQGAVPESDVTTRVYGTGGHYTYYAQPVYYTAPSSCPTPFTVTTHDYVMIPSEVAYRYTPGSVDTSTRTLGDGDLYYDVTAYLTTQVSSVDIATEFDYSYYVRNCINPTKTRGPNVYPTDSGNHHHHTGGLCGSDHIYTCSLAIWIIVVASIIPALFVLGFLENYFWFRRLMLGKGTLRAGTVCWICISLIVLCFTRKVPSRSKEDQVQLRASWSRIPAGTRLKLWLRYGFRHRYPEEWLGAHPGWARSGAGYPRYQDQGAGGYMVDSNGGLGVQSSTQGGWVHYTGADGKSYQRWQQGPPPPGAYFPAEPQADHRSLPGFAAVNTPQSFTPSNSDAQARISQPPELSNVTPARELSDVQATGEKDASDGSQPVQNTVYELPSPADPEEKTR